MNDVVGIRNGDAGVFKEAYAGFHVKVFRYFLKRAMLHETARDLTQQLFIKLWQSRHTLSDQYSLETQLFVMANSVWIDHLRAAASSRKYFTTAADLTSEGAFHSNPSPHLTLETSDHFKLAIRNLPPVRRKVFILKIFHGFTNQEIAGRLSVSIKTVEDHLYKAARFIRSTLTGCWLLMLLMY